MIPSIENWMGEKGGSAALEMRGENGSAKIYCLLFNDETTLKLDWPHQPLGNHSLLANAQLLKYPCQTA
jgi:hypothetical protein